MGLSSTYRILNMGPPGTGTTGPGPPIKRFTFGTFVYCSNTHTHSHTIFITGKSTKIDETFFALDDTLLNIPGVAQACDGSRHCTKRANVHQLTVKLGDRVRALDIEWLDSWGITEDNMGGDSLAMFVDGRADGKNMQDTLHRIGTEHVTNPADVLVLFSSINGASDEVMRKMQQAANIAKERNIDVLLAVTHIDHVPEAEREQKRLVLMQYFGLKPEKVILTKHERSGSRSCEVDKSTLDLFYRTMQAIQDSRINKLTTQLDHCRKAQELECVAEIERLLNRQTSITSVPPQKATTSPTAKPADYRDSMAREKTQKREGFLQSASRDELHLLLTQLLPPVTVALAIALVTTLGILLNKRKREEEKRKREGDGIHNRQHKCAHSFRAFHQDTVRYRHPTVPFCLHDLKTK